MRFNNAEPSAWPTARHEYRASPGTFATDFTERVNKSLKSKQEIDRLKSNVRILPTEVMACREQLDRAQTLMGRDGLNWQISERNAIRGLSLIG